MNSAGIVKIKVTVQHSMHSGRSASFVVGGQSRFAPCPPMKHEPKSVSEQVPCLIFTHISWVLNSYKSKGIAVKWMSEV